VTANGAGQAASRAMSSRPEPDLVQLLTPEGERVEHPDYPLDISVDELKSLYRDLVLVRRIDFEAIALQRQGELGIWASLLGQEAAQVGSGRALGPKDMAFPTYREHGVAWCRGVSPMKLLELFRGVSHGGWDPQEHMFHLYTIVIGAQTLHATGYAMGIQRDGALGEDGAAAIVYFGDGATAQGDVNEAFIWASVSNAPVVFFCQNNQWAISEPLERQTRIPLYPRVRLPRHQGRRQRRARVPGRYPRGAAGRQGRPGTHAHRGVHLPDGRAHHDRRPDALPALR
jgi:pyruvate dehydrogenase E1 component alpha subunit